MLHLKGLNEPRMLTGNFLVNSVNTVLLQAACGNISEGREHTIKGDIEYTVALSVFVVTQTLRWHLEKLVKPEERSGANHTL